MAASETAGVREHAGVSTSTLGIGDDFDESLLGPMAVTGGGQFHRLRNPEEFARTFLGELGKLFKIAASNARLEIEASPGTNAELVSYCGWQGRQCVLAGNRFRTCRQRNARR